MIYIATYIFVLFTAPVLIVIGQKLIDYYFENKDK